MKKCLLLAAHLLFLNYGYCQSRDNYWCLGYQSYTLDTLVGGITMDFPSNTIQIAQHERPMWFQFSNASICDSTGNLLFYTNGVYIANSQDDTMLNGSGINPSLYTTDWYFTGLRIPQADIIIPKPGNDSLYYLIHETNDIDILLRPIYLFQSIINMNGDSGKGQVILKNYPIISDTLVGGSITMCRHANGRDWWLLVPRWGNQVTYNSYLITPDTIQLMQIQSFPVSGLEGGQACFSPDGAKYIWNNCYGIAFFDFDRCSGALTLTANIDYFTDSVCWIGASISPNSRYAYLSHGQYIFQFDLQSPNIPASIDTVAINDNFASPNPPFYTQFVLHQLAPDGKIYISTGNSTFHLHCIDQPDSGGVACNVLQHSVTLPRFNVTIPNFPNYNLGRLQGSPCDTLQWTGIQEQQLDFRFSIFPNPISNNTLNIGYLLPQNKSGTFQIYDITGKIVFKYNLPQWSNKQSFSLPKLSNGIYQCILKSNNQIATRKLIVLNL